MLNFSFWNQLHFVKYLKVTVKHNLEDSQANRISAAKLLN